MAPHYSHILQFAWEKLKVARTSTLDQELITIAAHLVVLTVLVWATLFKKA